MDGRALLTYFILDVAIVWAGVAADLNNYVMFGLFSYYFVQIKKKHSKLVGKDRKQISILGDSQV